MALNSIALEAFGRVLCARSEDSRAPSSDDWTIDGQPLYRADVKAPTVVRSG